MPGASKRSCVNGGRVCATGLGGRIRRERAWLFISDGRAGESDHIAFFHGLGGTHNVVVV